MQVNYWWIMISYRQFLRGDQSTRFYCVSQSRNHEPVCSLPSGVLKAAQRISCWLMLKRNNSDGTMCLWKFLTVFTFRTGQNLHRATQRENRLSMAFVGTGEKAGATPSRGPLAGLPFISALCFGVSFGWCALPQRDPWCCKRRVRADNHSSLSTSWWSGCSCHRGWWGSKACCRL